MSVCVLKGEGEEDLKDFPPVNSIRNVCAHVEKNGKAEKKMLVCVHKCI